MAEVRRSFGFPLSVTVVTDVGRVRTNNEDAFGQRWLDDGSLFIHVADGMGGHEAGEVASSLAVRVVEDTVCADPAADPRERLYNGLLEANSAILEEAAQSGTKGMGTTSIVCVVKGREVYVGQIGDSRCFQIRRGHLVWRTLDHTRVQMLVDQGEISPDDARNHPEAGMLTRALGHSRMADGRPLEPEVRGEPLRLEDGDALVLSSDGLHDLVEDWEIARTVAGKSPEEAAEALVELACERGGHDNVTVAVVIGGVHAAQYDPNFVPDTWPPPQLAGSDEAETTYSEVEEPESEEVPAAPPAAHAPMGGPGASYATARFPAAVPPEPPEKAGGGKKLVIIGVAVAAVVVIGVVLIGLAVTLGFVLL